MSFATRIRFSGTARAGAGLRAGPSPGGCGARTRLSAQPSWAVVRSWGTRVGRLAAGDHAQALGSADELARQPPGQIGDLATGRRDAPPPGQHPARQTLLIGWRSPLVVAATLASLWVPFVMVETPRCQPTVRLYADGTVRLGRGAGIQCRCDGRCRVRAVPVRRRRDD
jgi:hypothetical protein